jgi:hypothetical protein
MSPDTKDLFQVAASGVAIIGGLVAASKALAEFRRANDQRREDMRWKQAEMAKRCLDEIRNDSLARAALKMLDWSGLSYERPGGTKTGPIDRDTRRAALRTTNTIFSQDDDSPFIRDAYDALFDGFERLEHFIRMKLIVFDDVEPVFRYYSNPCSVTTWRRWQPLRTARSLAHSWTHMVSSWRQSFWNGSSHGAQPSLPLHPTDRARGSRPDSPPAQLFASCYRVFLQSRWR